MPTQPAAAEAPARVRPPRARRRTLPHHILIAGQRILDRAGQRLRALSRGAAHVLWEFVRLVCRRRPRDAVVLPLEAIARELELSLRQVERLVAELVAAGLIRRYQDTSARPDPFDDAQTWLTDDALAELDLLPTKMSAPQEKAEESKGKGTPVDKPRLWIPPGTEALHEAVGDGAFRGLLRAASRRSVRLQDVMAKAGERVLAAKRSIAGYVHTLLNAGGDWAAPPQDPAPTHPLPEPVGQATPFTRVVAGRDEHRAVSLTGDAARARRDAWRAGRCSAALNL